MDFEFIFYLLSFEFGLGYSLKENSLFTMVIFVANRMFVMDLQQTMFCYKKAVANFAIEVLVSVANLQWITCLKFIANQQRTF